jgi:hypothetical protein
MDRDQWTIVYTSIKRNAKRLQRDAKLTFGDLLIVAMYAWSVANDRPMCWACNRSNYRSFFRPRKLPSVSQFTRRVKCKRTQKILQWVHEDLANTNSPVAIQYIDGKPLVVGVASRDPDARKGKVMGGFAKGYKVHPLMTAEGKIPVFAVTSLNKHEMHVAAQMLTYAPKMTPGSLLMADGNYDAATFHKLVESRGGRLLTKPRGFAKHEVTRRQMGAARRECNDFWKSSPAFMHDAYRHRIRAEGILSALTSYGGGLGPLPAFVRRLPRVTRWVGTKIILYHARLACRKVLPRDP